jgi:hypothetical protein
MDDDSFSDEGLRMNWGCIIAVFLSLLVWAGIFVAMWSLGLFE